MTCFNEKNQHIGKLETLKTYCLDSILDVYAHIRWCPECGAVVIDRIVDGRQMGCYLDMKFPGVAKRILKQQGVYKNLWEKDWTIKGDKSG